VASGEENQPKQRGRGPQQGGFVVARPFGIPVIVSPYWFIIAGVFIVIYANELSGSLQGATTRYLVAAAFVVLLYLSVLVHELSHSVVAQGYGLPVRRIVLWPLGGVSEIDRAPSTPSRQVSVFEFGSGCWFSIRSSVSGGISA
jgi:Zn-dependent protease